MWNKNEFDDTISVEPTGPFSALQQFTVSIGNSVFGIPGFVDIPAVYVINRLGIAYGSTVIDARQGFIDLNGDPNLDSGGIPHSCF
jgi:hypothetical protein